MKKRLKNVMLMCIGFSLAFLCGNAAAIAEQMTFNTSNISLFGTEYVKSGKDFTAKNGEKVPASIFYTDEKGGYTNYLAVSKISEILDADIDWNGKTKTVDFGIATTPSASTSNLPFMELSDANQFSGTGEIRYLLKDAAFQSESAFQQTFFCHPRFGQYILFEVTNRGEKAVSFGVFRDKAIGNKQTFPTDVVQPGETLSRLFSVSKEGNELTSNIGLLVKPLVGPDYAKLDITLEVTQQDGDGGHLTQRDMTPPTTYDYEGLTMEPKNVTPSGMELVLKNDSKISFQFGEDFWIERQVGGQWERINSKVPDDAVIAIGYTLRENEESTWGVSWQFKYGDLPGGEYRILKSISKNGSLQNCCYLAVDFNI